MKKKHKPYSNKQTVFVNMEGNTKEALEEICYRERKTLTQKIQELVNEEVRKKAGGLATPIAITYNITEQSNMLQTTLSLFRDFDTVTNVYNRLQSEQITLDAWNELDRYQKNFKAGLLAYRSNIIQR